MTDEVQITINYPSDWHEFEAVAEPAKEASANLITRFYGPRCDTPMPGCPICDSWKLFDELFKNPFDKPEVT